MLTADSPHSLPAGLESRTGTPLQIILKTRIETRGPITFAEFMEACLYHPEFGYYTRQEQRPLDDYYTSVDMHPIFGRLLARQFAEMWELLDKPGKFFLVECGAGVGRLASQILDFAHCKLPEFYGFLHYVAVERSPHRQALQAERMGRHVSAGKCSVVAELPARIPAAARSSRACCGL